MLLVCLYASCMLHLHVNELLMRMWNGCLLKWNLCALKMFDEILILIKSMLVNELIVRLCDVIAVDTYVAIA